MARTMDGPRKAAEFLRGFSREVQLAEIQEMLKKPTLIALAHGIAVELKVAEDDELKGQLTESLKLSAEALAVGYGGLVNRNVNERAANAGKNAIFAQMGAIDKAEKKED